MMNLQEIEQKKVELFEAQRKIAEELQQLQDAERNVAKAARQDSIDKIKKLLIEFKVPKYEIDELYRSGELPFIKKRHRRSKEAIKMGPEPGEVVKNKERADQYNRLVATGNLVLLKAKVDSLGDKIDDVLPYVDEATEAAIIGCLG